MNRENPSVNSASDNGINSKIVLQSLDVMGGTSHLNGGLCLYSPLESKGQLFSVLHQGNFEQKEIRVPEGVEFWAMDGGALSRTTDGIFEQARIAALMGQKIVSTFAPEALKNQNGESHLTNLSADVWRALRELIPNELSGAQFLESYGSLKSTAGIDKNRIYKVRLATEHPIYENERTLKFLRFLELAASNPRARHHFLTAAGELMVQSHFSYDHRCNLGNHESDLLVKLAREAGKESGVYGAKLSGDGDKTTVALLCDRQRNSDLEAAFTSIATEYESEMGKKAEIFRGN